MLFNKLDIELATILKMAENMFNNKHFALKQEVVSFVYPVYIFQTK
jgi:hypothetical protein